MVVYRRSSPWIVRNEDERWMKNEARYREDIMFGEAMRNEEVDIEDNVFYYESIKLTIIKYNIVVCIIYLLPVDRNP